MCDTHSAKNNHLLRLESCQHLFDKVSTRTGHSIESCTGLLIIPMHSNNENEKDRPPSKSPVCMCVNLVMLYISYWSVKLFLLLCTDYVVLFYCVEDWKQAFKSGTDQRTNSFKWLHHDRSFIQAESHPQSRLIWPPLPLTGWMSGLLQNWLNILHPRQCCLLFQTMLASANHTSINFVWIAWNANIFADIHVLIVREPLFFVFCIRTMAFIKHSKVGILYRPNLISYS